jgi:hypothetical protein
LHWNWQHSNPGQKTEYISIADTALLAEREIEVARGRALTKVEREIKKVRANLEKLRARAVAIGLDLPT